MYTITQVEGENRILYTPAIETIKLAQLNADPFEIDCSVEILTIEGPIVVAKATVRRDGKRWSASHTKKCGSMGSVDVAAINAAQTIAVAKALKFAGVGLFFENAIATYEEMREAEQWEAIQRMSIPAAPLNPHDFLPKEAPKVDL